MNKFAAVALVALACVSSAHAHRNPDNFYANRAIAQGAHVIVHQHRGPSAGQVLGAVVVGAVIGAAIERANPPVIYQPAPVPVPVPAPVIVEQAPCQIVYIRDQFGNFHPVGCR